MATESPDIERPEQETLIQLCREIADFQTELVGGTLTTDRTRRIKDLLTALNWPCSKLLKDRWNDLVELAFEMKNLGQSEPDESQRNLAAIAIESTWVGLETTCLSARWQTSMTDDALRLIAECELPYPRIS
jgi:hypothetical protein